MVDTGNHAPAKQPIRRMPFVHKEMVDEVLAKGVSMSA